MGVVPVIVIITVLALVVRITTGSSLFGMVGFLILFMLPVAIISSRIMWKKNIIKVVDKEDADTENQNKKIKSGGYAGRYNSSGYARLFCFCKNNVKTFPAIAKNNYHIKSANVICCPQPFSSKVFRYSNI